MKRYIVIAGMVAVVAMLFSSVDLFSAGEPAGKLNLVGTWKQIDDETNTATSYIQIYKNGNTYNGKIIKLLKKEDQGKVCDKCKGALKDKPIEGMVNLWNLKWDGKRWSDGRIIDPGNGETYHCYVELDQGGNRLRLKGHLSWSKLIGRSQYWYRLQ